MRDRLDTWFLARSSGGAGTGNMSGSKHEKDGRPKPLAPGEKKPSPMRKTLHGMPATRTLPTPPLLPKKDPVESDAKEGQSQRPSGSARISERPSLVGLGWIPDEYPSVLLVGEGHPMQEALAVALTRHNVESEVTSVGAVLDAVVAATPKLVLILGDAAKSSGKLVLGALRSAALDETVPVVVLLDDTSLEARLEAIRQGAAAVIPRSASADQIARRIADIAHAGSVGKLRAEFIGDTTLAELLEVLGRRIARTVAPAPVDDDAEDLPVRLTLGRGQDLVELVDDFAVKLGTKIVRADRVDQKVDRGVDGAELLGERAMAEATSSGDISGLRILLADDDSGRADGVAEVLRRLGATVVVSGLEPRDERMARLRQADPIVLLMRSEDVKEKGRHLLDRMKADLRLRWASLVAADWDELSGPIEAGRVVETLIGQIATAGDPERALRARADSGTPFDVRLEGMGPARALRALSGCSRAVRMTVHNPRVRVVIDLSEGLVVGATARVYGEPPRDVDGPAALAALLMLGSGRLTVDPIAAAGVVNVMSTAASALDMAEMESPPIPPSWPPPAPVGPGAVPGPTDAPNPRRAVTVGAASEASKDAAGARRPLGRWLVALVGVAAMTTGLAVGRVLGVNAVPASHSAPETSSKVAAKSESPGGNRAADMTGASLVARAKSGEPEAMAAVEQRPVTERTIEETLALAEGRTASERRGIDVLRVQCSDHPELLDDVRTATKWLGYARNPAVASVALAALASLPSPTAADLVYEVWIGTEGRTVRCSTRLLSANGPRRVSPLLWICAPPKAARAYWLCSLAPSKPGTGGRSRFSSA
jgi:DNA-binding NarL/FixJ family response regulator